MWIFALWFCHGFTFFCVNNSLAQNCASVKIMTNTRYILDLAKDSKSEIEFHHTWMAQTGVFPNIKTMTLPLSPTRHCHNSWSGLLKERRTKNAINQKIVPYYRVTIHVDKIPHLENCQFHKLQNHQSSNIGLLLRMQPTELHWKILVHFICLCASTCPRTLNAV